MPLNSGDAGCMTSLAAKLGHEAPFADDELAAIESLTVTHARDLNPLVACVKLRHLRVIASEVTDLQFCDELTELVHLEIHCSIVHSMLGLACCSKLERVDLLFTSLADSSDVIGSTAQRGTLVGNPWTELSWGALNELGMLMELPSVHDWKLCRALWDKAGACSGRIGGMPLVVRPGLPELTANKYDALQLGGVLHQELDSPTFTLEALFSEYEQCVTALDLTPLATFRELGTSEDALGWIAGAPFPEQAAVAAFVRRFPSVTFYRNSAQAIAVMVSEWGLPDWYATLLSVLSGWLPALRCPPVQFSAFEFTSSPRATRRPLIYDLGLREHGDDETGQALQAAGFIACALSMEDPQLMLAFRNDGDLTIYEYHFEDLSDAVSEGRDISTSIYPAFRSYASMLGSIVSLHPPDRDPIVAR